MNKKIAFVCFGEINTPIDRLNLKHDEGLEVIKKLGYGYRDMLLYGTQFEGNSMRGQIGVEVWTLNLLCNRR